jgi:predicted transcriptional regulator
MLNDKTEYDNIQKEIEFMVRSEIKLKMLANLCKSDLNARELSDKGINYGSISSNIKQLEKNGLITRYNDKYHIKNSVKKKMINILYLNKIIENINSSEEYINMHLVKNNKLNTLEELPLSNDYEIIHNTPLNPYKVVNNFTKNMTSEGNVKIIFTHVHPEFKNATKKDALNKTTLKILAPSNIKEYLIENKHKTKDSLENRTIMIKSIDNMHLSLAISENEAMFVLYNNDTTYDTNAGIVSHDPKFIKWGGKLFDEIESLSDDEYIILNDIS